MEIKKLADIPLTKVKSTLPIIEKRATLKLEPVEVKNKFERSKSSAVIHRRSEIQPISRTSKV
jgi:hypothetical protein